MLRTEVTGGGGRTTGQWRWGHVFPQVSGSAGVRVSGPQADGLRVHSCLREVGLD